MLNLPKGVTSFLSLNSASKAHHIKDYNITTKSYKEEGTKEEQRWEQSPKMRKWRAK